MLALILSGGYSTRMRQDKGLLFIEDTPMIFKVKTIIVNYFDRIKISIRAEQLDLYKAILNITDLVVDDPIIKAQGPLKGILTVHSLFPQEDIFVVASDMPNITSEHVDKLLNAYQRFSNYDGYCFKIGENAEPLFAIYTSSFLSSTFIQNELNNYISLGPNQLIKKSNFYKIKAEENLIKGLKSINTKEDLQSNK